MRLSSEPTQDATVTITSNDAAVTVGDTDGDSLNGDQNTLTFTSTNWNTPQTVTLTAADDDNGTPESATITHTSTTASASEYANLAATITANTTDDDAPSFVFDADPNTANDQSGPLQLNELSSSSTKSADYTVRLSSLPTQTVTATITSGNTSSVTVDDTDDIAQGTQNTLTFTSTNWNTPQTVTLSAQQDDNGFDENVTITHSAATTPNSEYTNVTTDFTASVTDDETPAITLSTTTLTVPEEDDAAYTVQLETEPVGGDVTVSITGAGDGLAADTSTEVGIQTSLTFTSANWDTARTVTVTAANDDNGENEMATFRHTASGADYGNVSAADLEATSTDNDTASLQTSTTTLTVNENANATYTIRLSTQPSATVTVTVSGASGAVTVDTATTSGDQNTLTFTTMNWATVQTVTVAAADDGNAVNETPTLAHTASGGDYASLPSGSRPSVQVTVDDDDTAGILLDADTNTPNDQSGPLALNELPSATNNSVDYTVRLSSEPTQDATVTITSNDAAVTVGDTDGDSVNGVQNALTFTSTNWNTPQTVTLTAADDDNGTPESATITHTSTTATTSEYANLIATITANTTDDDTPSFVFDADPDTANDQSGPLQLDELSSSGTNSADYTVRLSSEPTQTVTATITSGTTSSVTVDDTDTNTPGDQNTLTFTATNWNTPQTVTLTAQQDDNGFDETVTITHSAATTSSSEYTNVSGNFTASVNDNETPAITLSSSTLTVPEEDDAAYTVQLATEPVGGSVTVTITGAGDGLAADTSTEVGIQTSLTFTTANWDTERTVTVTAANDDNGENETATFRHAASGADYGSVAAADLEATATDDDTASLQVSTATLTVNENANATYAIRLNTQPSANVTVTVSGASGAVTVDTSTTSGDQNTLTFTSTNWATNQTVTVSAGDDDNASNEEVSLAHDASGGYGSLAPASRPGVTVTVDDDDTAGILVDADPDTANDQPGPVLVHELSTATNNTHDYTVRLSSEPTQTATVTITSNDAAVAIGDTDTDTPGDQNTLVFTNTNWNTPQTVTLTAAQDDDGVGESATITHTSTTPTASEYTNLQATLTANTTDDDPRSFVFDADPNTENDQSGPLALNELFSSSTNSADYTVRLRSQPTQTVTATITSADTAAVTVDDTDGDTVGDQNTLTFTSTNWNTPQTVTLTAQQDDDGYDESVTIAHAATTATNSEYANVNANFTASVNDDETPAITLSTTTLTVPEEDDAAYTVRLATEPVGGDVTVTITGAADGLTASPTSLTFTTANWNTARSVTVTAANDQNGQNEDVTFRHAATGADYGTVTAAELVATSTDNDTASLQVSTATLAVHENANATYTVRLSTQPSATVTVTVSGASGAVTVDTSTTTGDQNTLTFTNTNWATPQTVTVAAGDDGNIRDEEVALAHTASGGDYASLPLGSRPGVTVTVDDDDTAGILLDADPGTPNDQSGPLALNELPGASNNSVDYAVRLSSEPTQTATVTITSDDAAVTVGDTDTDTLGDQNTLTFTSTNWNTPQTVTLTAADDDNGTPESATITHTSTTSSASEYANLMATITANTTDDDTPSFVFDADPDTANDQSGPLQLDELSSSSTNSDDYTVRLSSLPTRTVTATIASGNTSSVTVDDTDGVANGVQNTLTFTSANWNTPQTVTLTAQQDDNGFDESVTIAHTAATTPNSEYTNVDGSFTASVNDNETPAITLSSSTLTVPEEDDATYTVQLATEPVGGSVTVTITGAGDGLGADASTEVGIQTSLTFTTANWDTERTVTVTAANDDNGENETATFRHTAAGADYGSVAAADLEATSTDNDTASLQTSTATLTVNENANATYTIRLSTQPSADVTVTVSGASGAVTVDTATTTGDQNTLTFTTMNWATAQTVTVAAADDGNAVNETPILSHTASGGGYGSLPSGSRPSVQVTVDDDDTAGILLDADPGTANDQSGPLAMNELPSASNNSVDYTVRLSSEPTQDATVTITSSDAAVTVGDTDGDSLNGDQNTLTFTSTNWNTPQTVTLTAADDDNGVPDSATITHTSTTSSASEYMNLAATITANTTDDDTPAFVFDADPNTANDQSGPLALNELFSSSTNSNDYTVRLSSEPTQTVTATITSSNTSSVTVDDTDTNTPGDQNTLTFTATNWNTPQTVTLSAQQDDNGFDESVTITHSAATTTNSEYRNVAANFTASVTDDETPAISLSTTNLTVPEEDDATYTVRLATEPVGGDVTVAITGAGDGLAADASTQVGVQTSLTFTTANWDTERTVTVTAANDDNGENETATFRHTATGADYGNVAAALLEATATDNDTASLQTSTATLTVNENANAAYTIRLNTQPSATVTVTVSGATGAVTVDTAATSGDQNTLTFTNANWATSQTVTVSAGDDDNARNEEVSLAHTASGGDYASLPLGSRPGVTVTVDDDDTAGILVDADPDTANDQPGPVLVHELQSATNNTHDYTVRLSSEPTQTATVTITSNDAAVAIGDTDTDTPGDQNTLTFTSTNWNTPQTVTLTAAQDDDGVGESATITHTATTPTSSEYTNLQATLTANTNDDDPRSFVFDADPDTANDQSGPLALNELFSSSTNSADYTVRLSSEPTQTVTATITSGDTSSVTVGDTDGDTQGVQNTLTFTATNWSTPQTVTLTAQEDDNGFDESVTIAHAATTATNSEYRNVNGNFTASVTDDETPAITLSTTTLTVPEENSATYTVRLATEPVGGNVTVAITGAADGLSTNLTSLTFTTGNWNTLRTVRVTAANDQNGENEMATFRHAPSGADYGTVTAAELVATSTDNDTSSLDVTPTQLEVDENNSGTYRVRLNTQPTGNVTVTVSGATGAVTVDTSTTAGDQNTMTFTTTTWSAYQTVTVAAGDDGNAVDETPTLAHTASGGGYGSLGAGARPSVQLTVDDDDTAGILLDADPNTPNDQSGPLALAELSTATNNSVSYTVRLSSEPTQTATVTITSNDTTAVTVDDTDTGNPGDQNTLTFTSTNWNTPQTVTLTAAQDSDGVGENVTITHTASTASTSEYTNLQATITATTTDALVPDFVFDADPSSPATDEAGPLQLNELSSSSTNSADYTVRLPSQPTQTVTATITSGNTASVTVDDTDTDTPGDQNTLTFTSSNWNTPQTVTLSAQQDDNGFNESVTITHTAATTPNSEYTNVTANFTASVTDDETPAITLSTPTLTVLEEDDAAYTVRLATEPVGGSVTVTITGAGDGLAADTSTQGGIQTSLTFTTANWDTERTVTVTAANDLNGENETVTFRHTASGADYGSVAAADLEATSTDNDTPGLQASRTQLTVNENSSATYTIRLNTQPSANVTVTVSGASGAVTVDTATTSGNQNTLTFTSTNWATTQTVTVAAADDGNAVNETPTLTHTASGGGYSSLAAGARPSVQVTVDDDDTAGILLDADPDTPNDQSGPLALNELPSAANNSVDYTVRLSSEPTQDATVTITSNDDAVTVGDTDGDSVNGVQNTLVFTSTNWNTPQTVTLTAADDNNGTPESATITHTSATSSASEYTNLQATITANTTDDDAPAFVFDADPDTANDQAGPLQLNELSSSSTNSDDYTVRLSSEPTQTVTATITSGNTSSVTVDDTDGIAQGIQNTLTFTSANWDTPQTVTLSAQQDDNGFDENVTITHSAATTTNSEYRNVNGNFTTSVTDDETPAIALSTPSLTVPEEDDATYTVRLATEPVGGNVTVTITGAGDGLAADTSTQGGIQTSLTFTTTNWDTERTVTVTAANDLNGENETATFRHTATGADYGSVAAALLEATATDNDTPSLQVSTATLTVDENANATYTIRLNTQPSATVTVTVSGATGAVTVDTAATSGDQNTLTFTNANWATNQTVTVSAGDDDNAHDEEVSLAHTASGGDYASLPLASRPGVTVTVDDDDTAGILIDADPDTANDQPGPVLVNELSTATNNTHDYTVRLSSEPTQTTTVTITSNDAAVAVDDTDGDSLNGVQNTLTFTNTNWSTPQTVTLTAAQDDDGVGESATITHTSSTPTTSEYTNLQATLSANTNDDDPRGFVFDADPDTANDQAGPLQLNELSSSSTNSDDYTVRLSSEPTQTVTATITSGNTASVTVGDTDGIAQGVQNTLTFTAANWDTPQTVTLSAQQDDNGYDESVTIAHSATTATNSEYRNVHGSFTASVNDDETPAIVLSTNTLTVPEENDRTYTVRLATEPVGGSVTVDITGAENDLSASPTRLVFTAGNWDTARTVTVTAANDQNGQNETATFRHTATGADYGSVAAAEVEATSTDDDAPSLQVSTTALTVNENSSGSYTIRLNTQPSATVTVTVSGATGAVTVDTSTTTGDQNTLTFTNTNWATAQTVTVAAGDDGNARNEQVSLTHTASGGDYAGLAVGARPGVTVTVTDNDTAGILLDADPNTPNDQSGPIALAELSTASNNSASYTVRLSSEPTQTATVTVTSNDTTAVTVDDTDGDSLNGVQNTLTFTNTNWNTPQTVTLTAAQDTDGVGENVTITHTAATTTQSEYTNLQATITANTTDAQAPGFVFDADPSSPATNEAGPLQLAELSSSSTNTDDYTVRLTSQPTQTVTATITSSNTLAVTVDDTDTGNPGDQNTLTFTASNWNTPQTVTLTAQQDDNGFDESVTIAHAAATTTNSEYRNVSGSFMATVNDDETPAIALSTNTLTVPEENSAAYTVQLATEPVGGSVTVDITGAADGLSASPTRLVFTTGNWDTARTVRITAANDQDGENETVTFRHAASGADYGSVTAANLVATSTDNDTPSLNVTPTTLASVLGPRPR